MSIALLLPLLLSLAFVSGGGGTVDSWSPKRAATAPLYSAGDDPVGLASHTLGDAFAVARQTGRPVLVYVRAAWCGPCRRLERGALADATVRMRLARFHLVRLNLDGERRHRVGRYRRTEAEWAARLGADATPTLVFLTPDGAVLGRRAGLLTAPDLAAVLDAVLAETAPASSPRSPGLPQTGPLF